MLDNFPPLSDNALLWSSYTHIYILRGDACAAIAGAEGSMGFIG